MKRITQIALLLVAATSLAYGQTPAKEQKPSDEQALTKIENDWGDALLKQDVATVERFEAPEYMSTSPSGELSDRAQGLAELKSGAIKFESLKLDDLKVRVFGDTAVVYGLDTEKSSYKGKDTSGQYRWTDVFVKRNGVWQAVSSHASKVEKH